MSTSRPTFTRPTIGSPSAQQPGQTSSESASFEQLRARHEEASRVRGRQEFQLEQSDREVQECLREAQALGVNSLEELQELVARQEEEERKAREAFEAALAAEEESQRLAEEALAKIENEKG